MTEQTHENRQYQSLWGMMEEEQAATSDIVRLGIGNTSVVYTDDGVVVIDLPLGNRFGRKAVEAIRKRTDKPIYAIIYTHGHIDHIWSVPAFLAMPRPTSVPCPTLSGTRM